MRSLLLFANLILCAAVHAQPVAEPLSPAQAQALVSRALATELRTAQDPAHPMRYLLRKQSPRLTTTKQIVESRDGDVARLVSVFDKPLSPTDELQEDTRLSTLAANPSLQDHRRHSEDQDISIVLKLLRMLPDAFVYRYAGTGTGPSGPVQKFTFTPRPGFIPPDFETQALTALTGQLWIDSAQERVTHLEGHLQQDTDYGWGILGKLNKGGWVQIDQADVGAHQWRIVTVKMDMTLRVLFKTKILNTQEQMSGFSAVPAGIGYRQAIQLLRGKLNP